MCHDTRRDRRLSLFISLSFSLSLYIFLRINVSRAQGQIGFLNEGSSVSLSVAIHLPILVNCHDHAQGSDDGRHQSGGAAESVYI
jgi:hypothetical protein